MSATIDYEALGFTQAELQERLLDRLVDQILYEDGARSDLHEQVKDLVFNSVRETVQKISDEVFSKNIQDYIENAVFQETNRFGEPRGDEMTFKEFLSDTANKYLTEQVNYDGRAKHERGGVSWSAHQTRIAHLIHEHLHYDIEKILKDAVKTVNSGVAEGLQETVKIQLTEITNKLKVTVK